MKDTKNIFTAAFESSKLMLGAVCAVMVLSGPVIAADNGCSNDNNERINQTLAMCSVHAYNIGAVANPESPAEREAMNQVVALKTTIMTQQMKKQYDYLEVTIRRFKTQLEKAILTAQMEAAGAGTESGGASGSKTQTTLGEDCTGRSRTDTVYCLRQNYAKMRNAISAKNFSNALKEQIVKDALALNAMDSTLMNSDTTAGVDCRKKANLNNTENISNCVLYLSGAINKLEEGGKQQTNSGYGQRVN